jgi:hypothetical protein
MMLNIFDAFIISYFLCYCLLLFIGNNFLCCCGFIVTIFADFIKFYFFVIGQIDSCMFIQVNKLALKEISAFFLGFLFVINFEGYLYNFYSFNAFIDFV